PTPTHDNRRYVKLKDGGVVRPAGRRRPPRPSSRHERRRRIPALPGYRRARNRAGHLVVARRRRPLGPEPAQPARADVASPFEPGSKKSSQIARFGPPQGLRGGTNDTRLRPAPSTERN